MSLTMVREKPEILKIDPYSVGVVHEIVQIHPDGHTCSVFHQLCCTVNRNGPAMRPATGPAVALVKTLRLNLQCDFVCTLRWPRNGPAMGLQWGRTRSHGACNGLLQWACNGNSNSRNGPAMGLQWACNGPAMGLQLHFDVPAMGFSHV